MIETFQSLRTFISSPGDVPEERESIEEVINQINHSIKPVLKLNLDPITWEKLPPLTPNLPDERIQDILNEEISNCKIFILILWKRFGSTELGHEKSNTQREVELAIKILKEKRELMFLSYFRNIPDNKDQGPQEKLVKKLRGQLEKEGIWYRTYSDPQEFKEKVTHDLYRTAMRFRHATKKYKGLNAFWQFGLTDRKTYPSLSIIYPSMDRAFMHSVPNGKLWQNRLVPNVVFEDYKALQKIEKTLRIINFREFRIYNTLSLTPEYLSMNSVWICLPRNNVGLSILNEYKDIAKFKMIHKKIYTQVPIHWRKSLKSRKWIKVYSPLSNYLREQRSHMGLNGEWHHEMQNIITKDYSIIARFNRQGNEMMVDGVLKDFFFAGLRGLGTWGAAWFLDHRCERFLEYGPNDIIQLLLEVEYRDGRIFDVKDVSNKPQSYFDEQNNIKTIRKNIIIYNKR